MTDTQKLDKLLAAHYRIMRRKHFWYESCWMEASKRLCVMASNLRLSLAQKDGKQ